MASIILVVNEMKYVINPANYSVLMNFVKEGFVAEGQYYLIVKSKDRSMQNIRKPT